MISIFWKTVDEETGFIERIELPDDTSLHFNAEEARIDLLPMRDYIGHKCIYYKDNIPMWTETLDAVEPNENGIMSIHFTRHPNE